MSIKAQNKEAENQGNPGPTSQPAAGLTTQTKQVIVGLLSRAEVAQKLGVCYHTIQRLTRRGELPALVLSRRMIRYQPETVEAYIKAAMTGRTGGGNEV